ncbi:MAG: TonB-dependent receptor [Saprospiraceae bacterium]|nr:TonB-dependent receptor [Saprospiraceae bacterium]
MQNRLVLCLLLILAGLAVEAQSCLIQGGVVNEKEEGVEFASVGVYQDSVFLWGQITDGQGRFSIPAACGQKYRVELKYLGYSTVQAEVLSSAELASLHFVLKPESAQLKEVLVRSRKPVIERKADRLIYYVDTSLLAANHSAMEVLKTTPSVWVDGAGNVRINGRVGAKVMINGKLLKMSGVQLQSYLNGLDGEQISRIEVIAVPGAEYDAASKGGILNIVMKKKFLDGFQSNLFGGYEQGRYPEYSTGIFSNYKKGRLTTTTNFYIFQKNTFWDRVENRANPVSGFALESTTDGKMQVNNNQLRLGAEYDLSDNQLASVEYVRTYNLNDFKVDAFTGLDRQSQSNTVEGFYHTTSKNIYQGTVLNYQWTTDTLGSNLKILGDYIDNDNFSKGSFVSDYYTEAHIFERNTTKRNSLDQFSKIYSGQADFLKNFKNSSSVGAGLKFNGSKIDNDVIEEDLVNGVFVVNPQRANHFVYDESIAASYLNYSGTLDKFQYKVGLRLENATVRGKSLDSSENFSTTYLDWFPSLSLLREFGKEKNNSMSLSANRKIERPDFEALNPFEYALNEFTILRGNPALRPEYTYTAELNYTYQNAYSLDAYYSRTDDIMNRVLLANQDIAVYQVQNISQQRSYGLSANLPITILKDHWRSSTYLSVFNNTYASDLIDESKVTFTARFNQSFNLKSGLRGNLTVQYSSKELYANLIYDAYWQADANISMSFLKQKLTVSLGAQDIFRTKNNNTVLVDSSERIRSLERIQTQKIQLYLFYRLNIGKSINKRGTESSASGEKSRLKS